MINNKIIIKIPQEVKDTIKTLEKAGFEAFIVGGCVRDVLENTSPNDWDIATNAKPKEVQKLFKKTFYDNKFFTVKVITSSKNPSLQEIEITTYRNESKYSDKRHPDKVKTVKTIEEDLSRRDFTVNAMAIRINSNFELRTSNFNLIDPFKGQKDLKNKIIRAVGEPEKRFSEDALRLLRAVRFTTTLGKNWKIEQKTLQALKNNAYLIQAISKERIRDEFIKIIISERAHEGIILLQKTGLLKYIIPELEKGVGISQNRHHIYTIFQHSVLSLKYAVDYSYNLNVRLAALFHDIAKPQTKRGEGPNSTFYNHDIVGAKIAMKALERLKFPSKTIEKVGILIRNHMFFYDPEVVTESSVRRLIKRAGKENIKELLQLRIADRKGSGVPKAKPYRLRHLEYIISKVSKDPISVQMLKINGNDVMKVLNLKPGPKIGLLLNALLAEVLDDPKKNKKEHLLKRVLELNKKKEKELKRMGEMVEGKKTEIDQELREKYWIK